MAQHAGPMLWLYWSTMHKLPPTGTYSVPTAPRGGLLPALLHKSPIAVKEVPSPRIRMCLTIDGQAT